VIEFQLLDDLVADAQFDHVYHEHRFFFSLRSFTWLAGRAGFSVLDWEHTPAQGGSARVTLGRRFKTGPEGSRWLEQTSAYNLLQVRANRVRDQLLTLLDGRMGRVAGYAASAKGTTLLNFCGIDQGMLAYVVDETPAKIGKVMPGTSIPITGHLTDWWEPDAYLLLARNYLGPVLRREHEFLNNGGRFIVPIPTPVVI
jgi:novobiocin biosynthesis protein NovU/D-mycarose 3-C-methyltransferase